MDLDVLRKRVLSGISEEQFNQEYFYLTVPQHKLKSMLAYRCDKNILHGKIVSSVHTICILTEKQVQNMAY